VHDDHGVAGHDAGFREPARYGAPGAAVRCHLDRRVGGIGRRDANRVEQIPLVLDGVSRSDVTGPMDANRVHPSAPGDVVPDAHGRTRQPGDQRTARTAVKIDRHVEPCRANAPDERKVVANASQAAAPGRDDQFVEVRVSGHDGCGSRFHDISNPGVLKVFAQSPNRGRREHHVADLAQTDEEKAHWVIG
jgi:hypothetical protein